MHCDVEIEQRLVAKMILGGKRPLAPAIVIAATNDINGGTILVVKLEVGQKGTCCCCPPAENQSILGVRIRCP